MDTDIIMDRNETDRKLSVPKICHEFDGELNISDNKLFQRRMKLNTEAETLSTSAHGRSSSFRNRPRPKLLNVDVARSRRSSLPSPSSNFLSVSYENLHIQKEVIDQPLQRVRSFKTTSKGGIINRGDSFKRSSTSVNSSGSVVNSDVCPPNGQSESRQRADSGVSSTYSKDSGHAESTHSTLDTAIYKIAMLGDKGVGKSSLINQFMTSEFVAFENDDDVDITHRHVTVLLNSEESTLELVERVMDSEEISDENFHAFVVVFSITDRTSYQTAVDFLYNIRYEQGITKPTILIANKIDLVRKRKVSKEETRAVAKQYDCKYTETSAALNHHIDELLVGILSQVKLQLTPNIQVKPPHFTSNTVGNKFTTCAMPGPKKLLNFIFRKHNYKTSKHECENLFTL